jgi:hypothetical protein
MAVAKLYAALGASNSVSDLYEVDPFSGTMTSIGPIGFAVTGLAFDPTSGILYGATSNNSSPHPRSLITIDPASGAGTYVGTLDGSQPFPDIDFDSTGQLYGSYGGSGHPIYRITKTTATKTLVGATGLNNGIGIDRSTDTAYVVQSGSELHTVSLTTGADTFLFVLSPSLGAGDTALAVAPDGTLWASTIFGGGDLYFLDTSDGSVTNVGALTETTTDSLAWGPGTMPVSTPPTPPANDNFADATDLVGDSGSLAAEDNTNATGETDDPLIDDHGAVANTMWYSITPAADCILRVSASGSGTLADTLLAVYSGSALGALTELAFDGAGGGHALIDDLTLTAGATYYIEASGLGSARGTFDLDWLLESIPTLPLNTSCSTAFLLPYALGDSPDFDNRAETGWDTADPLFAELNFGGGAPLWFRWKNAYPDELNVTFSIIDPAAGEAINEINFALYTGSCDALTMVYSNSEYSPPGTLTTLVVPAGDTVYIEIDGYSGDTSNPPMLPFGERGRFALHVRPFTVSHTYRDWPDSASIPIDSEDPVTETFSSVDYVELGGDKWQVLMEDGEIVKARRWDGSTRTDYTITLPSGYAFTDTVGAHFNYGDACIETDGSNLWLIFNAYHTIANPYNGGTWAPIGVLVYIWNGTSFDFIDVMDGITFNTGSEGSPSPVLIGAFGSLIAIASSDDIGSLYVGWGETGHQGTVIDGTHDQLRSRFVLGKFSTSAKLLEYVPFDDLTTDYPQSSPTDAYANSDLGGITGNGTPNNAYGNMRYVFAVNAGALQMFCTEPQSGGNYGVGFAQPYIRCYSVDVDTLNLTLAQTIDYAQPSGDFPAGPLAYDATHIGASLIGDLVVERGTHADPVTTRTIRYLYIAWHFFWLVGDTPAPQLPQMFAVDADLSGAPYPFDNDVAKSAMLTPSGAFGQVPTAAFGIETTVPHQRIYTDLLNQVWVGAQGDVAVYDRKCRHGWIIHDNVTAPSFARMKNDGTELPAGDAGDLHTVQNFSTKKWVFEEPGDLIRAGHVGGYEISQWHIGRDSAICTTTETDITGPPLLPSLHIASRF